MGWQVLENEVRRVVLENTADVEPQNQSRMRLEMFLSDPQTVDIGTISNSCGKDIDKSNQLNSI